MAHKMARLNHKKGFFEGVGLPRFALDFEFSILTLVSKTPLLFY
jgi:hypothetical protein